MYGKGLIVISFIVKTLPGIGHQKQRERRPRLWEVEVWKASEGERTSVGGHQSKRNELERARAKGSQGSRKSE